MSRRVLSPPRPANAPGRPVVDDEDPSEEIEPVPRRPKSTHARSAKAKPSAPGASGTPMQTTRLVARAIGEQTGRGSSREERYCYAPENVEPLPQRERYSARGPSRRAVPEIDALKVQLEEQRNTSQEAMRTASESVGLVEEALRRNDELAAVVATLRQRRGNSNGEKVERRNRTYGGAPPSVTPRDDATRELLPTSPSGTAFMIDELRAELYSLSKKKDAEAELSRAHFEQSKAALERRIDELQTRLAANSASGGRLAASSASGPAASQETQTEEKRPQPKLAQEHPGPTESIEQEPPQHGTEESLREALRAAEVKISQQADREATMEHHVSILLTRVQTLQQLLEREQKARHAMQVELENTKEINHVLAVRLKAALVDREASAMEAETRRILTQQNEAMEQQLAELRRVIASLLAKR